MAKTVAIKFEGKDNLSASIKQVSTTLDNFDDKLEYAKRKFEAITESQKPLKKRLRELQVLMADMNFDNLTSTDLFSQMAETAGSYRDAIDDARTATAAFANDNSKLQANVEALSGIAAVASVATGAMSMLGIENKKTEEAILKVQSALSILNGVQQIANVLNKDSTLMLRIKRIQQIANAAATEAEAAAQTLNTGAVIKNTAAVRAWAVTKAVAKAVLGDFSGLIILGAAALVTYTLANNKSADAEKSATTATSEHRKSVEELNKCVSKSASEILGKYLMLKNEWIALSDVSQKNQWIKNNSDAFKKLGLDIKSVNQADKVFISQSNNVIKALINRAKAEGMKDYLRDLSKQYAEDLVANSTIKYRKRKSGETISGEEIANNNLQENVDYFVTPGRKSILTQAGAERVSQYNKNSANSDALKRQNEATEKYNKSSNYLINASQKFDAAADAIFDTLKIDTTGSSKGSSASSNSGSASGSSASNKSANEIVAVAGSLSALNDEISKLTKQRDNELIFGSKQYNDATLKIDTLKNKLELLKNHAKIEIELKKKNLTIDDILNSDDYLEKIDTLKNQNIEVKPVLNLSTFTNHFNNVTNKYNDQIKDLCDNLSLVSDITNNVGLSFSNLANAMTDGAGKQVLSVAGIVASAIAQIVGGYAAAVGKSGSQNLSPWEWIAFTAAGLATLTATIAQVKNLTAGLGSYASGGIVSGSSYIADKNLARVNAGEMILNGTQQQHLFNLINNDNLYNTNKNSTVEFKISGRELVGVLNNYNKKVSRVF